MTIKEDRELRVKYEEEILELIDNQGEYTRGDLQGRVEAIVFNILLKGKEFK